MRKNVFLTGGTGFLGAFILAELCNRNFHVHCLVRCSEKKEGLHRLHHHLKEFGLWQEGFDSRITIIPGDISLPGLGLSSNDYALVKNEVELIIHNAAVVNFAKTLSQLYPSNVGAVKSVIELASGGNGAALSFVSTLGLYQQDFRKKVILDSTAVSSLALQDLGYTQSKWHAESLLGQHAEATGLPVKIFRASALTGSAASGKWKFGDIHSRLLSSFVNLNTLPDDSFLFKYTPVDYAAKIIVSLSTPYTKGKEIFNVVNADFITMSTLARAFDQRKISYTRISPAEVGRTFFEKPNCQKPGNHTKLLRLFYLKKPDIFAEFEKQNRATFDTSLVDDRAKTHGVVKPDVDESVIYKYLDHLAEQGYIIGPLANRH